MSENIAIFYQDPPFQVQDEQAIHIAKAVIEHEEMIVEQLNIIFVNDPFLQKMHHQYLEDDTPTDIITFDLSEGEQLEGELYISLDRAQIHAQDLAVPLKMEISRLIIHGILHLGDYDDIEEQKRQQMRERENFYLTRFTEGVSPLI